jgi:hypothetical protein
MRSFAIGTVALLVGCDSPIQQVGPGTAALGDDDDNTNIGSMPGLFHCDRVVLDGTCVEYSGPGWDGPSRDGNCGAPTVEGMCSLQDTLGGCTVQPGSELEILRWFFEGPYYSAADASSLQADCETNMGYWMQGPQGT